MWRLIVFISVLASNSRCETAEEAHGVKWADKCEVCKVVATELEAGLNETGRTSEVLEMGYAVDDIVPKKRKEYTKSELRLVETSEGVCNRIMEYNIHKEHTDSKRFAKGMSQTFQTLHGLVDKGVKVDLGIPEELWDNPSVEIHDLKRQCEELLETYEEDIEHWYQHEQNVKPLTTFLCSERVLKGFSDSCLTEKGDTGGRETIDPVEKSKEKVEKRKETKKIGKDEL